MGDPLSSLFMPDATLHIQKVGTVLSGTDIDKFCETMQSKWEGSTTLHTESNIVLEVPTESSGVIVNHSCWTALIDGEISAYGTHADVLEEKDGEWLFRRRVVRHLYSK